MTNRGNERLHRHGHRALISLGFLLLAAVLVLWGWNTLAVDLFGAPVAKFKHALAFEAVAGGIWLVANAIGAAASGSSGSEA